MTQTQGLTIPSLSNTIVRAEGRQHRTTASCMLQGRQSRLSLRHNFEQVHEHCSGFISSMLVQARTQHVDNLLAVIEEGLLQCQHDRVAMAASILVPLTVSFLTLTGLKIVL